MAHYTLRSIVIV